MDRKDRLTAEELRLTLLLLGAAIALVVCG